MAAVKERAKRSRVRAGVTARRLRRVALIIETAVAPRRRMLEGLARYMQEHEAWAVYLKPHAVELSLEDWLREWDGDGIIAAVRDKAVLEAAPRGIPMVDVAGLVGRQPGVPLVHTNDYAVGRLGAEHLLERGFTKFGFCEYVGWFWSTDRRRGFEDAVAARGFSCDVYPLPLPGPGDGGPRVWEAQQRRLEEWLAGLAKPTGVMATNDPMGHRVLEVCQRTGVKVPEEIAVVGADNDECICRVASPPLSSVVINDVQRGYEAAAVLDRMMRGGEPPAEPVLVEPPGVAARASTDIYATDDTAVVAALRFLRDHACDGRVGVDDVVRQVPLCRSMLQRRFRRVVGRSVHDEIIRLRVNRAIELLTDTDLELKAVAYKAGFGSQARMNVVFRAETGRTPGSYRRPTKGSAVGAGG